MEDGEKVEKDLVVDVDDRDSPVGWIVKEYWKRKPGITTGMLTTAKLTLCMQETTSATLMLCMLTTASLILPIRIIKLLLFTLKETFLNTTTTDEK